MAETRTLLLTDVVDSTQINEHLGDAAMGRLWAAHDRLARDLVRAWRGREVGRSDGFLLLFEDPSAALGFALAYHRGLSSLAVSLKARVGMHMGPVMLRENLVEDQAQGATPFEIDGVALPLAARVMAAAMGGQTLLTAATLQACPAPPGAVRSHGHWRLKGIAEPVELFELGEADAHFAPPPDSVKAYRVVRYRDTWLAVQDLPHKLPAERDAFIGRNAALHALAQALDQGARLVTLLGIGGIGKTRLALGHARAWLGDYPGGVWFCDLKAARSVDGIAHAVAQTLGLAMGKTDPVDQLATAIAERGACLLILDNFEQVARHAEATVGVWLEKAPAASFITTSRELLGIAGEQALVLAPMGIDEATQLFRERARAAGVPLPTSPEDEAALPELMKLLDCLPLAIELAVSRARVMPPRLLLRRMGERFKLLATEGRRHDRQSTMRATLDWSWDLLSPAEQSALAQLSAFEGGFTLEAAEAVLDVDAVDGSPWAGDLMQALVEKSLVRSDAGGRFDLLRTVHDYAAERLASLSSPAKVSAWHRHAAYYSSLTEQQATADRCADADNLVLASRRTAESAPALAAGALLNAWAALRLTGPFRAALELTQILEPAAQGDAALRAAIDRVAGGALHLLGQPEAARQRYGAALLAAQAAADPGAQSCLLSLVAELDMAHGDHGAARAALDMALTLAAGDSIARCTALNSLGKLKLLHAQWAAARRHYEDALALAQAAGHGRWQGGLHGNLGLIARAQGQLPQARLHFTQAAAVARDLGDRQWEGNARCNLGLLLHDMGDDAQAWLELDAALVVARAVGHRRLEATALCNLGLVTEALGEVAAARDFHAQAVAAAHAIADGGLEGTLLGHQGLLLATVGEADSARQALQQGARLLAASTDPSGLGLLLCQQAIAEALLGDQTAGLAALAQAQAVLAPLAPAADSEPGQALRRARGLLSLG